MTRYGREDTSFAFRASGSGTPDRPRARPAPGAGGRPPHRRAARLALHLPGRRAGPRRGRGPARSSSSRTRCTSARAASIPGRDGCRVPLPWSGDEPPVRLQPGRRAAPSRGCRQPAHWARAHRRRPRRPTRTRCSTSTGRRCASGAPSRASATVPLRWLAVGAGRPRVRARATASSASPTSPAPPSPLPPHAAVLLASAPSSDGHLPPDATVWLRPGPAADGASEKGGRDEANGVTATPGPRPLTRHDTRAPSRGQRDTRGERRCGPRPTLGASWHVVVIAATCSPRAARQHERCPVAAASGAQRRPRGSERGRAQARHDHRRRAPRPARPRRRSTRSNRRSASSRRSTPGSRSSPRSTTGRRRRSPRRSPAARCRTSSRSRSPTARA